MMILLIGNILYMQNNWRVKNLENWLKNIIVVGVTFIWRKAVAVSMHNSYSETC